MRNALIIGTVLIIALAVGFFALNSYIYSEKQAETVQDDVSAYFQERMIERGIELLGAHPIEGFDAALLMSAYPALAPEDFEGVEAFEGKYSVQNKEPVFVRTHSQPVSSAERTISVEGYATLLSNISARLSHPTYANADVDVLIAKIDSGGRIEVKLNQTGSSIGVEITPLEVLEDSRCPIDVQCIWAGTVRVRATVTSGLGTATHTFVLHEPMTTEAEEITLVSVSPSPESEVEIADSAYVFTFSLKER